MCTLLAPIVSAETPHFESIKKNLKNGTEAVKKVFPYTKTIKDENDRGIDGFKVVVPPECAQYLAGFAGGSLLVLCSAIAMQFLPDRHFKLSGAALASLNVGIPLALWHPKCKTGPYLAAGATTAATIAALTIIAYALTD